MADLVTGFYEEAKRALEDAGLWPTRLGDAEAATVAEDLRRQIRQHAEGLDGAALVALEALAHTLANRPPGMDVWEDAVGHWD
jgi:hypothetical protein